LPGEVWTDHDHDVEAGGGRDGDRRRERLDGRSRDPELARDERGGSLLPGGVVDGRDEAVAVALTGEDRDQPCCCSCWVKCPAALASCVPFATSTFTLECTTVDVVVERETCEVVVVVVLPLFRWPLRIAPAKPASTSAAMQATAMLNRLTPHCPTGPWDHSLLRPPSHHLNRRGLAVLGRASACPRATRATNRSPSACPWAVAPHGVVRR